MPPPRDATTIIYVAGTMVGCNGIFQLLNGNRLLGVASLIAGAFLIIQRYLRNRRPPKA